MLEQIKFVFQEEDRKIRLNLSFTKNLLPEIRLKKKHLIGPADALSDCSFYDFIRAHAWYVQYYETKNPVCLTNLVAALYKKQNKTGTKPVNPEDLKDLDFATKYAVFLFFESVMQYLMNHQRYGKIWKRSETEEPEETLGLSAVVYALEERGLGTNLDYLYNVLDIMYMDYLKEKELEKLKTDHQS